MRLDQFLVNSGLQSSRERAKQAIIQNQVSVNGVIINSPSHKVDGNETITFGSDILTYVSRGALKLKKAIEVFEVDFTDRYVLDIGSSTGGFTEVSLEANAKHVIALDVGTDILHQKLRNNPKITIMENTDFRTVEE